MLKQQSFWSLEAMLSPLAVVVSAGVIAWNFFTEKIDVLSHDGEYVTTTRGEIIRNTQQSLEELV